MPGLLASITQRISGPAPRTGAAQSAAVPADDGERAAASLALAREVLHSIEQFVVSTPDLDTMRFLRRTRGVAAGLTDSADVDTLRLFRDWSRNALSSYGTLQRSYLAERDQEMWRLLDLYSQFFSVGRSRDAELSESIARSHARMREVASLNDLRAVRQGLEEEVNKAKLLVEEKVKEDRRRVEALGCQVASLEASLNALRGQANFDVLTGLRHRAVLMERLRRDLAEMRPFALAIIDVEGFKTINRTLGHPVGDRVLAQVERRT